MKERSFDEMIAYFNRRVADMDISQDCKMELLGMIAAIGYKHETSVPQWIPCSERLPEKDGRYLVWAIVSFVPDHVDEPCTYQETTIANFFTYRGGAAWDGHSVEKVLAWRELPEPWRGEEHGTTL